MFAAMEQLIYLDYALFEWIHHGLQHPWLDAIMPLWREKIFAWMLRNAESAMEFFRLPTNRVVELGSQVEI